MRVVLSWLRELCPVELPPEELADVLSVKGVHVEAILRPWEGLEGVVAAKVLEVGDHPNSEKLCVTRVTDGRTERQVLAGVRNMRAGDVVPLAAPGARVPALAEPLSERKLRGLVSEGMLCSPRELGISADHGGILVLPPDTPVGVDVKRHLGLDDAVFDIEIEPNRPDLMSVLGVAREVSAAIGVPLRQPDLTVEEDGEKADEVASVEVRDAERCPRYVARVIHGVRIGPSPLKVQARLTAAGMRPLSNVVDATNYAMLEIGQPLHAFDLALLRGSGVVVRRAEEGERLVTLDDVERTLTAEDLVIADRDRGMAIAGIMGTAPAEVHAGTTDVLLESAYFEPKGVIRTSRRLGLQTEASMRFGRGADPENPPRGADLCARLIVEWSGGTVLRGQIDVGEQPARRSSRLRASRASHLIGYDVTASDVEDAFGRLGIATRAVDDDALDVEVPSYRVDLEREVDLIEEVARVRGYDTLGSTLPAIQQAGGMAPSYAFRRRAREALVRAGLREALSLSFASRADLDLMGHADGVVVANAPSAEEPFLRTSLLPSLLRALQRNLDRGVRSVALFEVGHVARPGEPVDEREHAAGILTGPAGEGVMREQRDLDVFDAKGAVEALLEGLGAPRWTTGDPPGPPYHPGRSASVHISDDVVGWFGELHPTVASRFGARGRVACFEIDLSALMAIGTSVFRYRDVPRFPPVHRDLAFVVAEDVPAEAVRAAIADSSGDLAGSVVLFDVFTGGSIGEGRKSLAFSIEFRATDRTLTDEEAEAAVARVVERLRAEFGAELRAG